MKRILIIGSGGAGKTTLAQRLGELLQIEVIHLDSLYWHAGWVETSKAEWLKIVAERLEHESWIMDGNYSGTLEMRLSACDTVIWLDLSRWLCLSRVIKRRIIYRQGNRPELAAGCPERLSWEFIKWIWDYPGTVKPKVLSKIARVAANKKIIHLTSKNAVAQFLHNIKVTNRN